MDLEGLFAGLDVSTQSCKLVVIDAASCETVHVDAVTYDADLLHYRTVGGTVAASEEGASESDPRMWTEAVELVLSRLAGADLDTSAIRCLSVSGQQHGLVALDEAGELARPLSKLWNDFTTREECEILTERVGGPAAMIEEVGNTQRTGYTAGKIFHMLRHEPEAYARARTMLIVHNYVNWHLTGGTEGGVAVMEPGDASGTALWNPAAGAWSERVIDAIDPGLREKLPDVRPADRTIGTISARLADRFGLSPELRIGAGSGDNQYGAVGTANVNPGVVTISLGTSGTICTVTEQPFADPTGEIAAYADSTGRYLPLLCVSNMDNGYRAVLDRFDLSHRDFDRAIQRTSAGNRGRLLLPWYEGERTPDLPQAAPVYFGFGVDDFGAEPLCRAVLEGHVLNLHAGYRRMPVQASRIHLTGGLAQSPAWRQVIADVFEVETVPVEGEGAALGAAIHAAWVWFKEQGRAIELSDLTKRFVPFAESRATAPDPERVEVHRKQKRLFEAVSARVRGLDAADPFALRAELVESSQE